MLLAVALVGVWGGSPVLAADPPALRLNPPTHVGEVSSVAFLEGGKTVASVAADGAIRLRPSTGGPARILRLPMVADRMTAGGRTVAEEGGSVQRLASFGDTLYVTTDALRLQGKGNLFAIRGEEVRRMPVLGPQKTPRDGTLRAQPTALALSADGKQAIVGGVGPDVSLVSLDTGQSEVTIRTPDSLDDVQNTQIVDASFSASGDRVAILVSSGVRFNGVCIAETKTGKILSQVKLPGIPSHIDWGSGAVPAVFELGEVSRAYLIKGTSPVPLATAGIPSWSADGKTLWLVGERGEIVQADADGKKRSERKIQKVEGIVDATFSADGSQLAVGTAGGSVIVLNPNTGAETFRERAETDVTFELAWKSASSLVWKPQGSDLTREFDFNASAILTSQETIPAPVLKRGSRRIDRKTGQFTVRDVSDEGILTKSGDAAWLSDDVVVWADSMTNQVTVTDFRAPLRQDIALAEFPARITAIAASPDGRQIAVASGDGEIRIFGPQLGNPKLTLFTCGGEWVAFDEQGRFDASVGGASLFGFQRHTSESGFAEFLPASSIGTKDDPTFQRPGLTAAVAGSQPRAVEGVKSSMGAAAATSVGQVRRFTVDGGTLDAGTGEWVVKKASVIVRAEVPGLPLNSDVEFEIGSNDQIEKGGNDSAISNNADVYSQEIELQPGKNTIGIRTRLANGEVTEPVFQTVIYDFVPPVPGVFRVFAVGLDTFKTSQPLSGSADARAFAESVVQFSPERSIADPILVPGTKTHEEVLAALAEFMKEVQPADRIMIYFSTHGQIEAGELFLLASNTDTADLKNSGIAWSKVLATLGAKQCKSVAVVMDACYSGAAVPVDNRRNMLVLASSLGFETSRADRNGRGIFTECLLEVLNDAKDLPKMPSRAEPMPYIAALSLRTRAWERMAQKYGAKRAIQSPTCNLGAETMPMLRWSSR